MVIRSLMAGNIRVSLWRWVKPHSWWTWSYHPFMVRTLYLPSSGCVNLVQSCLTTTSCGCNLATWANKSNSMDWIGLNTMQPAQLFSKNQVQIQVNFNNLWWNQLTRIQTQTLAPMHRSYSLANSRTFSATTMISFPTLTSLPLAREHDHRIPLLPGSAPINIKPYKCPHF